MIVEFPMAPGRNVLQRHRMGFFAVSNNNLAIRRSCAVDVGMYDPAMRTSEDVDICFRVARSPSWVMCREVGMEVRHKARRTLGGMMRQLWGWGINLGRPYAKTGARGLYLHWVGSRERAITRHFEREPFPLLVCAFVTDFHVAHGLAVAALLAWAVGLSLPAVLGALLALVFLGRSLRHVTSAGRGPWETVKLAGVYYLANVAFLSAAFCGALRCRMILVPASILPPRPPALR